MVTLALRRSRFSSCRALHLSLKVSSSILRTLFSCCSEARRLVSSSRRNWEMTMVGFPEIDAEVDIGVAELLPAPSVSLSLALSAMAVRQGRAARWRQLQRFRRAGSRTVHGVTLRAFAGIAPLLGCLQYCTNTPTDEAETLQVPLPTRMNFPPKTRANQSNTLRWMVRSEWESEGEDTCLFIYCCDLFFYKIFILIIVLDGLSPICFSFLFLHAE